MNLENLKLIFSQNECNIIYIKRLSPNDNSKNQIYFGGSFEILNILPISEIKNEEAGDWNKERFKASINFSWISDEGNLFPAPNSQLILYPKYPEVRFSGFLSKCEKPPSELLTSRIANRLLFFSVSKNGNVLGYVASPESEIADQFNSIKNIEDHGVFKKIELPGMENNKVKLINELLRIHNSGWIKSKRLNSHGSIISCESSNCGGYTLEAELGITPNGYSEPDYLGWEIKQFGVKNLLKITSSVITLMTPEPTHGIYKTEGAEVFIRNYGYKDRSGKNDRHDRLNFGGVHKYEKRHNLTNLELKLIGFDTENGKIRNTNGYIGLIDLNDNVAASWSFSSLLLHWNRKHNQACYIPSLSETSVPRKYKYGNRIILGTGTEFQLFLKQIALGNIYYDPGIKMENVSTKPKIKKRSQFRIKSEYLNSLYKTSEIVDVLNE
jgi:hypothetical protein